MNSNEVKKYFNMLQDLKDCINGIISNLDGITNGHISTIQDEQILKNYIHKCNDLQVFLAEM